MTKKVLIAGVLTVLFIAGSIGISNQYSYAADHKTSSEETITQAGEFIKNNPELLSKSINAVENKSVDLEDVVTNVDTLPITIGEIEFRKGLYQLAGLKEMDDKAVFNVLVEEKLIISYAIKNNVLPSKSEIDSFNKSERLAFEKDENFQKFIATFCAAANLSQEDYWNTYEYYNAVRIVTFKKAQDNALEVAVNKGEVKALASGQLNPKIDTEREDFWKKSKLGMKNNTLLKVNEHYLNRGFTLDNSKLYQ